MRNIFLPVLLHLGLSLVVLGQVSKQFSVENVTTCDKVQLHLKAKTGNCFVKPSESTDLLDIYSNQNLEDYNHSFSNEAKGKTCVLKLGLEQEHSKGVGKQISHKVFGGNEAPDNKFWKVYLTESKPYDLFLDYGLGNANIDLSGLSISKIKINTGSADVNVYYGNATENKVEMDTFFVKVDMGSLHAKQLCLSRSKVVMADVGFGNMTLDFASDKPFATHQVHGSVGAGNLIIYLPTEETPVLVKVSDSWLCSVNLSKGLKKIAANTYSNASYHPDSKNVLIFNLDVSMGKIVFRERSHHQ
jgi:hypothetical protein